MQSTKLTINDIEYTIRANGAQALEEAIRLLKANAPVANAASRVNAPEFVVTSAAATPATPKPKAKARKDSNDSNDSNAAAL